VAVGAVVAAGGEVAVADDPQAANKKSPKNKEISTMKLGLRKTEYILSTPPDFEIPKTFAVADCLEPDLILAESLA
jgi:hypothetical protein